MQLASRVRHALTKLGASVTLAAVMVICEVQSARASATDLNTILGTSSSILSFNALLSFLEGPFAQVVAILLIIGAVWRLRQNFEWGEAGTTVALLLFAIGAMALLPTIWTRLSPVSGALI